MARTGDTVVVMDGTYDNEGKVATSSGGGSVVVPQYSGTAGAPITFKAQNRGKAILNAASTAQSSTLQGCYGAWSYFDLYNVSYVTIQGFVIENACLIPISSNGVNQHDNIIRWNEFANIGLWSPPSGFNPQGGFMNASEYNFTWDGNIFHDIGGGPILNLYHGLYLDGSNVKVVNNIFYNITHGYDIVLGGAVNAYIANNTFAFNNPNRDGDIILWDRDVANSLQNVVIQDNVFFQPRNYAVVSALLSGTSIGGCIIQSNLTTGSSIYDNGSNCSQTGNLLSTDPKLVNTSTAPYDLHLQAGSPAIDSGINNSYTAVDMDNWPRPVNGTFDRGAYEFHAPATISASANPTSLTLVQGGYATATITATFSNGSGGFSVSGLPSGVTASFSVWNCSGSCTTTLTLNAPGTYQGTSNITVTATSGALSATTTIALSVVPTSSGSGSGNSSGDFSTGLVAEWKLQTNAIDSIGGDNGTLKGGGVWGYGTYNGINFRDLVLDGSSGFVWVPEKPQLEMKDQLTVAFWIRALPPPSTSNTAPRVIQKLYDWEVKLNSVYPQFTANGMYAVANYAVPQSWTHVVFTFASGAVKAYINGQPVSLSTNTFKSGATLPSYQYGLYIGTNSSLTAFYCGGLNDVRLYNRALSASDISALFTAVTPATLQ